MDKRIDLKSIWELKDKSFFIPSYQRGYRWTKQQAEDLLKDIQEFIDNGSQGFYCIQPLVVKNRTTEESILEKVKTAESLSQVNQILNSSKDFEVIDGQQRLTTIFIILSFLGDKIFYSIDYETREKSKEFLTNINKGKSEDNIDFHHIYEVHKTVEDWFLNKADKEKNDFKDTLLNQVKFIWYETQEEDIIQVFTRLNSGKIPLTNAELIKALFLNSSNFGDDNERIRLQQLEIASEWDRMEYALQNDEFWWFLNNDKNNLPTRIEFIFDFMFAKEGRQKGIDDFATFRFFKEKFDNNKNINSIWQEVKKCFKTLEEWFENRELYHKIGFLISVGENINDIFKEKEGKTKTAFLSWIDEKISNQFKDVEIEELAYGDKNIHKTLLLHNIQTMLNNKEENSRFPFDRYKKEKWDIEHIHAIASEVKVKKEEQKNWLLANYPDFKDIENLENLNEEEKLIERVKNNEILDENEFEKVINFVLGEEINGLENLCLLDRGTNRAYKNDAFHLKRSEIINREKQGTFIPICTRNVFMKYYSDTVKDLEFWNEKDRKNYLQNIEKTLKK